MNKRPSLSKDHHKECGVEASKNDISIKGLHGLFRHPRFSVFGDFGHTDSDAKGIRLFFYFMLQLSASSISQVVFGFSRNPKQKTLEGLASGWSGGFPVVVQRPKLRVPKLQICVRGVIYEQSDPCCPGGTKCIDSSQVSETKTANKRFLCPKGDQSREDWAIMEEW